MACMLQLDILIIMYNNNNNNNNNQSSDHKPPPPMSPRISFSNDFVESSRSYYRDAPVSTDFEFSVSNQHPMTTMTADELFSKGRLLPYRETPRPVAAPNSTRPTTLKDKLLVEDSDFSSLKPPKSSARWKGFLGLRKSHIGSKRVDNKNEDKRGEEMQVHGTKNSREGLHGGGSYRDPEFQF
ncbi:hypothetical protein DM860_014479 [Cuscuta australis]|uniref:Uncharacterized protein n=1 Tax=Cuscuta australis TaxID=267555 RepID=A0A328DXQ8_9ASTE|nr:hypothetical protein DM860_014479 [Cuscuta australis]